MYEIPTEKKLEYLIKDISGARSYLTKRRTQNSLLADAISDIIFNASGALKRCESEAELAFAKTFLAYSSTLDLEIQVSMNCGNKLYRADFRYKDTVFEVDGRKYHSMEYDKPRDLAIVRHGHAKRVYRIPATCVLYYKIEWLSRIHKKHPEYFSNKIKKVLEGFNEHLRDFEALICHTE